MSQAARPATATTPEVIELADGKILVTWDEFPPDALDPLSREIHGQILSTTGQKLGDRFTINSTSASQQLACQTVALQDGRFAAVFKSHDSYGVGGGPVNIILRLFDADGTPCGDDFRVTETLWNHDDPVLTVLQNGKLLVTFESVQSPNGSAFWNSSAVNAMIFDPNSFVGTDKSDYWNAGNLDDTIVGNGGIDDLSGNDGKDNIQGGAGADVLNGGSGNDRLAGNQGADQFYGGEGVDTIMFGSALAGVTMNLLTGLGSKGDATGDTYFEIENISGSKFNDVLTLGNNGGYINGLDGNDRLFGGSGRDKLFGSIGNDRLTGNSGADILSGGTGFDTFEFTLGGSGQTTVNADRITDYDKGTVGTGDEIDFNLALRIGGSAAAAAAAQASINATTAVATFAARSGVSMADALNDITAGFTAATDSAGEFALFQLAGAGDHFLFVSDGIAGVTSNDVLIRLDNITTIGSINLTTGDLTILT